MKNKKLIAVLSCILIGIFVLGVANIFQFAKEPAPEQSENSRLIGIHPQSTSTYSTWSDFQMTIAASS